MYGAAMQPPLISASGLGVRRNGHWAVRHVDLSVARGELVTLIGPNGGGKSTTARAMLGLIRPDEGSISRAPEIRISYLPQKMAADWTLPITVARFMRLTGGAHQADIDSALQDAGASAFAKKPLHALSGASFSASCWPVRWRESPICWCLMSQCRTSISRANFSSTI
jgi:zinc transport system ATP-binding protein